MPPDVLEKPVDVLFKLPRQPSLADPPDTYDRQQPRSSFGATRVEELFEKSHLAVATDEGRLDSLLSHEPASTSDHTERAPQLDRFNFSLE